MPPPTNKRNVPSASPASAGAPNTASTGSAPGGYPETGPLPRSALTEALNAAFEGRSRSASPSSMASPAPRDQAGSDQPDTPGQAPANATEVQPTPPSGASPETTVETVETPAPAEPGQEQTTQETPTPATEETPGEVAEEIPGQETPGEETTEEEPLPVGLEKRFGKLLGRIGELEKQLESALAKAKPDAEPDAARAAARPSGPSPLDAVVDPVELDRRESDTTAGLDQIEDMLARLPTRPQEVARELRAAGIVPKDADGQEDFSAETMFNQLSYIRRVFRSTLREIPKRRGYLASFATEHQKAVATFPWLSQKTDQRHALMVNFLQQAPGLISAPNHEYWVACAIEKHLELEAKKAAPAKNGAGKNGVPAKPAAAGNRPGRTAGPGTAANPTAGVRARPDVVNSARQKVLKEGTRESLSEYLQATNFGAR